MNEGSDDLKLTVFFCLLALLDIHFCVTYNENIAAGSRPCPEMLAVYLAWIAF